MPSIPITRERYYSSEYTRTRINTHWYILIPDIINKDPVLYPCNIEYTRIVLQIDVNTVDKWDQYIVDDYDEINEGRASDEFLPLIKAVPL